jgi:hypothetical protein
MKSLMEQTKYANGKFEIFKKVEKLMEQTKIRV